LAPGRKTADGLRRYTLDMVIKISLAVALAALTFAIGVFLLSVLS
jgi:hypothetical protein